MTTRASEEIAQGERFAFGQNWQKYSRHIDDAAINASIADISQKLESKSLAGKTFLDIGSGSGLSSLAAFRMGATVVSFDFDPDAVECTSRVRMQFAPEAGERWQVLQGSVLDRQFLDSLPEADVVYSWGVLHHTGDLWMALSNAADLVPLGGKFFIALYNDQGRPSRVWSRVKQRYNSSGRIGKSILLNGTDFYFKAKTTRGEFVMFARTGRLRAVREARTANRAARGRGMTRKSDLVDWVGGWPFEVSTPDEVFDFLRERGFTLTALKTCGAGLGCNVFVADRQDLDYRETVRATKASVSEHGDETT